MVPPLQLPPPSSFLANENMLRTLSTTAVVAAVNCLSLMWFWWFRNVKLTWGCVLEYAQLKAANHGWITHHITFSSFFSSLSLCNLQHFSISTLVVIHQNSAKQLKLRRNSRQSCPEFDIGSRSSTANLKLGRDGRTPKQNKSHKSLHPVASGNCLISSVHCVTTGAAVPGLEHGWALCRGASVNLCSPTHRGCTLASCPQVITSPLRYT